MYVICFYWEGVRWQKKDQSLAERYINNLYCGVKKFAEENFEFICFTNKNLSVNNNIKLRNFPLYTKKGVLPRLYMFSHDAGLFGNQVLCLDLDLVITGSLKDIMGYRGQLCVRTHFKGVEKLDGDIINFRAGEKMENILWKPFINNIEKMRKFSGKGGESSWIRRVASNIADKWKNVAPGQIASYQRQAKMWNNLPENVRIVSFHGIPHSKLHPHQVNNKWIKQYWK